MIKRFFGLRMKRRLKPAAICAFALLCFFSPVRAHAGDELKKLNELKEELRREKIERVNDKIASYNKLKSLEMKVYSLEDKVSELKTKKFDIEGKLDVLKSEKEKIRGDYADFEAEEKEIGSFLAGKIAEIKEESESLPPFHKSRRMGEISSVKNIPELFEFFRSRISDGEISEFYSASDEGKDAEILRLGGIFSVYKSSAGEIAVLQKRVKDGKAVYSWNRNINASLAKDLYDIFHSLGRKETNVKIPLDVSQGTKSIKTGEKTGLTGWFVKGGPVMFAIALAALAIIAMAAERFFFFRREYVNADKLMEDVLRLESVPHHKDEAVKLCEAAPGPVARMLKAGLRRHQKGKKIVEEMIHEQRLEEIPRLEKHLSTIAVLAGIAPLLGLLGTVSGMIATFHIITYHGGGDPRLLAGGISEALITTEFGLIVAIPAMLLHNYLSDKADQIAGDLEKNAVKLLNSLPDV